MDNRLQTNAPRVIAKLSISCGCGFLAKTTKDGTEHALTTGHILCVHGQIGRPEKLSRIRVEEVGRG